MGHPKMVVLLNHDTGIFWVQAAQITASLRPKWWVVIRCPPVRHTHQFQKTLFFVIHLPTSWCIPARRLEFMMMFFEERASPTIGFSKSNSLQSFLPSVIPNSSPIIGEIPQVFMVKYSGYEPVILKTLISVQVNQNPTWFTSNIIKQHFWLDVFFPATQPEGPRTPPLLASALVPPPAPHPAPAAPRPCAAARGALHCAQRPRAWAQAEDMAALEDMA